METERLIIRPYKKEDLQDFFEYVSNPEVVKFEPYRPMTKEEAEANLNYRMRSDEFYAVELKSTHKMIGNIYLGKRDCLTKELGYVFQDAYWHQGYANESCSALIDLLFHQGIHRIYAECDPENTASWQLLERLDFQREAYFKQNVFFWKDKEGNPIWKDTYVYSLLNRLN